MRKRQVNRSMNWHSVREIKNFNIEEQLASANLSLSNLFNIVLVSLSSSVFKVFSFMMQFFVLLFTVPFILLFMFKDGHKFIDALAKFFPQGIRGEIRQNGQRTK